MAVDAIGPAGVLVGLVLLIGWMAYQMAPERVSLVDGEIVKRHKRTTEHMLLSELRAIRFHYHAAVGLLAVWEFVDSAGKSLEVESGALGMKQLVDHLELNLPGFSATDLNRNIEAGDVEESICLWKAE